MSSNSLETIIMSFDIRDTIIKGKEERIKFSMISECRPYLMSDKVVTITDLDGVFFPTFIEDDFCKNVEKFRSLQKISKRSSEIIFWSTRTPTENCDLFPFISREKIKKMDNLIKRANPECKVSFICGLSKIGNNEKVKEMVRETTKQNQFVSILGSSFFDRRVVNEIRQELPDEERNLLYYFDTGHMII